MGIVFKFSVVLMILVFSVCIYANENFQKILCQLCIGSSQWYSPLIARDVVSTRLLPPGYEILLLSYNTSTLDPRIYYLEMEKLSFNQRILIFGSISGSNMLSLQKVVEVLRKNHQESSMTFICSSLFENVSVKAFQDSFPEIELNEQIYLVENVHGGDFSKCQISEVYSILNETGKWVFEKVILNNWNKDRDILTELTNLATRRYDLRQSTVRIVAQHDSLYESDMRIESQNGSIVEIVNGSAIADIIHAFQYMLNFTFLRISGNGWASPKETSSGKTLAGMGEQVIHNEAHLCVTASILLDFRAEHLQFLPSVLFTEILGFYDEPNLLERNFLALPFQNSVWLTLLLFFLAFCFAMICFRSWSGNIRRELDEVSISGVGFWVFKAFCLKGFTFPTSSTLRIIIVTVVSSSFLLTSHYNGEFFASVSSPKSVVKTYADVEQYELDIFTDPNIAYYSTHFLPEEKQGEVLQISDQLFVNDPDSAFKILDPDTQYIFLINTDRFYPGVLMNSNISVEDLCSISRLSVDGHKIMNSFFLKKHSPLKELFMHRATMLIEHGFMFRYAAGVKRHPIYVHCEQEKSSVEPLQMEQVNLAFYIMAAGVILAVLIVCLEKVYCIYMFWSKYSRMLKD